jgi:hypothetical protein
MNVLSECFFLPIDGVPLCMYRFVGDLRGGGGMRFGLIQIFSFEPWAGKNGMSFNLWV